MSTPERRSRVSHWRAGFAAFVVVALLAVGSGGASAYWTAAVQSLGASANAATVSVTTSTPTALTKQYMFTAATEPTANLAIAPLVFTNTSTSPLTLSIALSANTDTLASSINLFLWAGSGGTCPSTVPGSGTSTTLLSAQPTIPASISTVAAGASVTLCAATKLIGTMLNSQGLTVSPVLTVTGRVGTTWSAAASTPPFVQSVYRVPPVPTPSCVTKPGLIGLGDYVTLTWTAVSGATSYTVYKGSGSSATVVRTITPAGGATSISTDLTIGDLGLLGTATGTATVSLVSNDSLYGTTGVPTVSTLQHVLLSVRCPA